MNGDSMTAQMTATCALCGEPAKWLAFAYLAQDILDDLVGEGCGPMMVISGFCSEAHLPPPLPPDELRDGFADAADATGGEQYLDPEWAQLLSMYPDPIPRTC